MRSLSTALVLVTLATGVAFAAPTPVLVDTCGQVVPAKSAAYLAADLDCSAYGGNAAITLGKRASLDLGGYTFTADGNVGILCLDGKCAIRNGTVTGAATWGIVATDSVVENVTATTSGIAALSLNGKGVLRGSTVTGTAKMGVHSSGSRKTTHIIDSTISGHQRFGVWVDKMKLVSSVVTGNLTDPECSTGATCADLMSNSKPRLKDSTCGRSQMLPEDPTPGCFGWCICTDD